MPIAKLAYSSAVRWLQVNVLPPHAHYDPGANLDHHLMYLLCFRDNCFLP